MKLAIIESTAFRVRDYPFGQLQIGRIEISRASPVAVEISRM
jgi:hypothetical protein